MEVADVKKGHHIELLKFFYGLEGPIEMDSLEQLQHRGGWGYLILSSYLSLVEVGLVVALVLDWHGPRVLQILLIANLLAMLGASLLMRRLIQQLELDKIWIDKNDYQASKARVMRLIYWRVTRRTLFYTMIWFGVRWLYCWHQSGSLTKLFGQVDTYVQIGVVLIAVAVTTYMQLTGKIYRR